MPYEHNGPGSNPGGGTLKVARYWTRHLTSLLFIMNLKLFLDFLVKWVDNRVVRHSFIKLRKIGALTLSGLFFCLWRYN